MAVPDFLTHYHLPDLPPFRSISDLTEAEWREVCLDIAQRRENDSTYNRKFGFKYREVRLETETILREKFISKGGKVSRPNPHYFCLGISNWWKSFCDHKEIRLPLTDIAPETISFTYPDSFTSMGILWRFGIKHDQKPYHGQVFLLHELEELIKEFGMPTDAPVSDFSEYQNDDLEIYVEAQLWSDEPIKHLKKHD